jgi:hypothetical protein
MSAKEREAKRLLEPLFPIGHAIDDADVWDAICFFAPEWATRKQIADAVGRRVTPSLITRIERMVAEGLLEKRIFTLRNNARGYQYRAVEG